MWMDLGGPYQEVDAKVRAMVRDNASVEEFITWLVTLPDINAVQVIEEYASPFGVVKLGTVVYTVPFEDVHG